MTLYVTKAGLAAEREALATGRVIKIKSVVVDSVLLPENINPDTLTAVQLNPTDQNGQKAIYPAAGESVNNKVLIAWTLPSSSGDYQINGLGFVLEDGTLWGYQRAVLGYKPDPAGGTFFEPHGTVTHITSAAANITCELNLEGVHATVNDIQYLISQHHNQLALMMRKIEGSLGRVRTYMNADDVDEEYLSISGQTINKDDYPDFFKHMSVTTSTMKLPDWGLNGYLRQHTSALQAGRTLAEEIKRHAHTATVNKGGAHTPDAYPMDLGTKSTSVVLNKRFYTDITGNHHHSSGAAVYPYDGATFNFPYGYDAVRGNNKSGGWGNIYGSTPHIPRTNVAGNHKHYVDVNFGTTNINIAIGEFKTRLHTVEAHNHNASIDNTGGNENIPNTTVVVFAVKVKYLTQLAA